MARKRTVQNVLDIKSRDRNPTRVNVYLWRLPQLRDAFDKAGNDAELLRYFPVAIVAAFETHFRSSYAELLDSGEPYTGRAAQLIKDLKLDWDAIRAVEGKVVSSGELIAHSLPLSSLGDIERVMNCLTAGNFLELLKGMHSSSEDGNAPVLSNPDQCFKYVARTFELRHIFCHESASNVRLTHSEVQACLDHSTDFLRASGLYFARTLDQDWNLSNFELREKADQKLKVLEAALASVESALQGLMPEEQRALLRNVQEQWRQLSRSDSELMTWLWGGGTGRGFAMLVELQEATKARTALLKRLLDETRDVI